MDPDPAIFLIDLQDANKKQGTFQSFFKDKKKKKVTNQVFLTIFA
jgi:hypothetical protein